MNVMVIAVHPDDETLGCGGTLLRHTAVGDRLHWLIVTSAHPEEWTAEEIATQARQVETVRNAYAFETLDWLRFPSTRMELMPLNKLVTAIRAAVDRIHPEIVYVPHWSDSHSDHRVTFDACMGVLKSFYQKGHGVRRILACEVQSETDAGPPGARPAFTPNVFVDISATLEHKLEILALYESETHPSHGPRSLNASRALARVRGATVGVEYAESFMLVREVL